MKENILDILINNQRDDVADIHLLSIQDMKRILKNIDTSIFGEDCCFWKGYITNKNKEKKSPYVNFYYKKKKVALHRLLYINYIDELTENDYIRCICGNKGICCNVEHYKKYKYKSMNKKKKLPQKITEKMLEVWI